LAQEEAIENALEYILDQNNADESEEIIDAQGLYDQLLYLSQHPINMNSKDIDNLLAIGLLNQVQISNIQSHTEKNGPLLAYEELLQIPDLDITRIQLIKPFIRFDRFSDPYDLSIQKILKESKNDLTLHYETVLQKSKAYDKNNPVYLGSPARIMIKYSTKFYSRWRLGLNIEKDAGEKINWNINHQKPGFDHYSAYVIYQGKGMLKSAIIGDFQCGFGQGLTFWRAYSFGKSSNTVPIRKVNARIRPHTGLDEYNFLRGFAFTLTKKTFSLKAFASLRKLDATPNDSTRQTFRTIIKGGYHRTASELEKANNLQEFLWGFNLHSSYTKWDIGISYSHQVLDFKINADQDLSKIHHFNGKSNYNLGLDLDYRYKNGHIFGEVTRSSNNSFAYLIGSVITPDPSISLSIFHRNYSYKFNAISSKAFGENSENRNEIGNYIGLEYKPTRKILLNVYFDSYSFPWIKSQHSIRTNGYDLLTKLLIKKSKMQFYSIRYRLRKINPTTNTQGQLETTHQIRLDYEQSLNQILKMRYRIDVLKKSRVESKMGYLFFIDLILQSPEKPYSISARYAIFNTEDYDTRIYAYERDLHFSYSIKPYYYNGQKVYLNIKWRFKRFFTFSFRFSHIIFPFLENIGSGNDLIENNSKSALKLQLRIRW
jgi:hypothetical protein